MFNSRNDIKKNALHILPQIVPLTGVKQVQTT